jgi:hypothetical protein
VSFAAITLCVASQRVFMIVVVFVATSKSSQDCHVGISDNTEKKCPRL